MKLLEIPNLEDQLESSFNGGLPNSIVFPMFYIGLWNECKSNMAKDDYFIAKALVTVVNFIVRAELGVFSSYDHYSNALRAWRRQNDDDVVNYYKALLKGKTNSLIGEDDFFLYADNQEYPLLYWLDSKPVKLADYDLNDPRWAEVIFEDDWYQPS